MSLGTPDEGRGSDGERRVVGAPGASVGVDGTSVSGPGVRGVSTTTSGTAYGTFGRSASAAGVGAYGEATAASGAAYGVYGKSASATGIGAYGEATATSGMAWGVQGKSASSSGIGVIGSALAVSGSTEGVRGQSTSPRTRRRRRSVRDERRRARRLANPEHRRNGVWPRATTRRATGVGGVLPTRPGVAGVANATSGDAWGVYGATLSSQGYGVVADGDSATIGDIYATGTKFFITEHPDDPAAAIRYACLEGGEVGVYHRGVGRLEDGQASIRLPEHFPMVASGHMTVYVTPLEDCGGLYVPASDVGSGAFSVRELGGGRGSAAFSYVIMAERSGFEDLEVVRPVTLAQKVLMSPRLTPPQKAAIRRALGRREGISFDADEERDLFALVQGGDFEGACRRLGGCAIAAGTVAPGPAGAVLGAGASRQGAARSAPPPLSGTGQRHRGGPSRRSRPLGAAGRRGDRCESSVDRARAASRSGRSGTNAPRSSAWRRPSRAATCSRSGPKERSHAEGWHPIRRQSASSPASRERSTATERLRSRSWGRSSARPTPRTERSLRATCSLSHRRPATRCEPRAPRPGRSSARRSSRWPRGPATSGSSFCRAEGASPLRAPCALETGRLQPLRGKKVVRLAT